MSTLMVCASPTTVFSSAGKAGAGIICRRTPNMEKHFCEQLGPGASWHLQGTDRKDVSTFCDMCTSVRLQQQQPVHIPVQHCRWGHQPWGHQPWSQEEAAQLTWLSWVRGESAGSSSSLLCSSHKTWRAAAQSLGAYWPYHPLAALMPQTLLACGCWVPTVSDQK